MTMDAENSAEKKILLLLESNLMSTSELAKKMHMRRDVVSGYLEALRDQGKVEMVKVGRSNVYTPRKHGAVSIAQ